ncbi:TetR/AcrR family transcriptional regulator [Paenibacillus sp. 1P07SE]|uniref:TetR/AcrR family transcriptional regulator n=1 Tax=Paenibacillus sp. 1P07SE TaxID=3132209 RepID=UPI0039A60A48
MSGRPREFKDTAVIEAAMEVFWKKGFEASSTQELCEQTGLGKGSLYNAFGSKHELFELALQRYQEIGIQVQKEILRRPIPIKDRLRELIKWGMHVDPQTSERRGCLAIKSAMEQAGNEKAVKRLVEQHVQQLEKSLLGVMEEGIESGEITSERSAIELARFFLTSYYGLCVLGQMVQSDDVLHAGIEGALAALS